MVNASVTFARPLKAARIGTVISLALVAADILGTVFIAIPANAPFAVFVVGGVLDVLTIVGAVDAWRGARWGIWLTAISRALSALTILPLLLEPAAAPVGALVVAWLELAVAAVAVVFLIVGLRRR
ncbi:hypothetical protein HII28_15355 [Planctomonas sp. JC2975]|uniref:hypothetical protein n=1 Tax=Planctomonas sp. JC2975 TaxID=2729626 RepID=UPI0014753BB1|nr:hypothetical protein [Planctomonas sp. JC2975]NNC13252.1 hypothetical protein [Planctomonas sp. JC2975]